MITLYPVYYVCSMASLFFNMKTLSFQSFAEIFLLTPPFSLIFLGWPPLNSHWFSHVPPAKSHQPPYLIKMNGSFAKQCNPTWMRGNFGLKLQDRPKLPRIHARFHCNVKWAIGRAYVPSTHHRKKSNERTSE